MDRTFFKVTFCLSKFSTLTAAVCRFFRTFSRRCLTALFGPHHVAVPASMLFNATSSSSQDLTVFSTDAICLRLNAMSWVAWKTVSVWSDLDTDS